MGLGAGISFFVGFEPSRRANHASGMIGGEKAMRPMVEWRGKEESVSAWLTPSELR